MQPSDFVYDNCFSIAMREGLQQRDAEQIASICVNSHNTSRAKRSTDLFGKAKTMAKRCKKSGIIV